MAGGVSLLNLFSALVAIDRHQMRGASNFWTDFVKKFFTLTFPKTTLWSLILCLVLVICPHCWVGRVWESAGGGLAGGSAPMTSKQKVQKERFWAKNPSSLTCVCIKVLCNNGTLCWNTIGSCWRLARHQADLTCNAHWQANWTLPMVMFDWMCRDIIFETE